MGVNTVPTKRSEGDEVWHSNDVIENPGLLVIVVVFKIFKLSFTITVSVDPEQVVSSLIDPASYKTRVRSKLSDELIVAKSPYTYAPIVVSYLKWNDVTITHREKYWTYLGAWSL